jgi:hypothetical protein
VKSQARHAVAGGALPDAVEFPASNVEANRRRTRRTAGSVGGFSGS